MHIFDYFNGFFYLGLDLLPGNIQICNRIEQQNMTGFSGV